MTSVLSPRREPQQELVQLGIRTGRHDFVVALAGNPNTGKSTVFNALTGLRQHTGNWPGKTVARAEGVFSHGGKRLKLVDLPGTYSLMAGSTDEEVARDFILFGRPDVTVVVLDATRLERNLPLALQILEITGKVVVCLNLMDEAKRHGIAVDPGKLQAQLGVPVIAATARRGEGILQLMDAVVAMAEGKTTTEPYRLPEYPAEVESALKEVIPAVEAAFPGLPNARWVSLRLLQGDQ
ncbi:MAG TPA: FeoB small GTPase domain-containing protein, partial [Gemmatimonadales bacterium]|nr:FeoB small GTPase domain-containing protein [Gemmatimonadales bacterium]